MANAVNTIAVLTSGGDAPGMLQGYAQRGGQKL